MEEMIETIYSPTPFWLAKRWKEELDSSIAEHRFTDTKLLRAKVFRNTMECVAAGQYVSEGSRHVFLPNDDAIVTDTKFYSDEITDLPAIETPYDTVIEVLNLDTLVATKRLIDMGLRPAALNLASRQNPGGGVFNGAAAQEENLFRRTNLFRSMFQFGPYASLYKDFGIEPAAQQYPLDRNWGGIYTPAACVFRGTEADGYPLLDEPFHADFIAVAALNRPDLEDGLIPAPLAEATKRKMRTIFRIAAVNGNDSIVLGAFGCGAYQNPPRQIARLFHEVIDEPEFKGRFRRLTFAILEDRNSHRAHNPEGNLKPFTDEFAR